MATVTREDEAAEPSARRRDRLVVGLALLALVALAWAYTAYQARLMETMDHADMRQPGWRWRDAIALFAMWLVMMVAMMTPGVGPMTTAFATINRRRRARSQAYVATAVFVAGYLLAWAAFSALATVAQIGMHTTGLLDPMMMQTSHALAAGLFLLAGLYQLSALKEACLTRCRSTDGFILTEWRDGTAGALTMGWRHGHFCIGCCAALMLLLFAVSVMDLVWVALLTVLVMIEKLLPRPELWRRLIGAGLLLAAVVLAIQAIRG